MKQSAGTLVYRIRDAGLSVLLVHPSGNYNRRAPWSIPKGLPDEGEDLEAAARRETLEETGISAGTLVPLGTVSYTKSRKTIHCFASPDDDQREPHCASWEVDCAEFVSIDEARGLIHPDQCPLLDRLEEHLRKTRDEAGE
jgi:predicted NUDIX family NTP pyrophosphohydrolase